ncbi:MAG: Ribosomal subunit interface protein [Parcubacteria group bacterium]|nr:Ribosomal subunit interface protein [Parcubacteria group bacterium]
MNIQIKATGIELTEAISEYVYKKIGAVEKYLGERTAVDAFVEVGKPSHHHKSGDVFRAEVRLVGEGLNLVATKESDDLYKAIDLVENEVKRELSSEKGRHTKMLRRGQRAIKDMMRGLRDWRKK